MHSDMVIIDGSQSFRPDGSDFGKKSKIYPGQNSGDFRQVPTPMKNAASKYPKTLLFIGALAGSLLNFALDRFLIFCQNLVCLV
jgi:hypothetical protein